MDLVWHSTGNFNHNHHFLFQFDSVIDITRLERLDFLAMLLQNYTSKLFYLQLYVHVQRLHILVYCLL